MKLAKLLIALGGGLLVLVVLVVVIAFISIDKIAKVNIYLDRRADFDEMNEIYKEFFGKDQLGWPARTTVEARLPRKDFLLEIDCVAEA